MRIPVYYTGQMVASASSSPSAAKPAAVVTAWRELFPDQLEVIEPRPLTPGEIKLAHAPSMVDDILACKRDNGFGTRSPAVARSLPYTTGAMFAAAKRAIQTGAVAVAPVSGFHHAGWDSPSGFCTFNGLVIAARMLWQLKIGRPAVGILDCDEHYGNGTDDIIQKLGLDWIRHHTARRPYRPEGAETFLRSLPKIIQKMAGCSVILYQAGADSHIDDPLGGFLTSEQLLERDRIVFHECRRLGIPIAWNLAGGYRKDAGGTIQPVIDTHVATMRACIEAYGGA